MSYKYALIIGAALSSLIAAAEITHWAVPAISSEMRLPDRDPSDGEKNAPVVIRMARNEYEPASFVVKSDSNLGKVQLVPTEFATEDGAKLPKEALDLKLVKVWYQDKNAWHSYFGDSGGVKLCPELLLNDEDLIRVDQKTRSNYARIREKDGTVREAWLSAPRQLLKKQGHSWLDANFKNMAESFMDATTLQPVTLDKDVRKQFFLTVHTTPETKAGAYQGGVKIIKDGKELRFIPVTIDVMPFTLGRPKTYSRPDEDFQIAHISYVYLDIIQEMNGGDRELAKKQLVEIYKALKRHGDDSACIRGRAPAHWDTSDYNELKERYEFLFHVDALKKAGLRTDYIIGGNTVDMNYWSKDLNYDLFHYEAVKKMALFKEKFGHGNYYASFGDEPGEDWLMKYRPLFEAFRNEGYKFFLAGWDAIWTKAHDIIDWHTVGTDAGNSKIASRRDRVSGNEYKTSWYACMHMGVENPDLQRRQNGLLSYLNGYTALMNYAYHLGPYNDDAIRYRPMVMFYGSGNGVIDTIQWEGQREGVDDIRYASYMKSLADKACASDKDSIRRLGRRALAFLESIDKEADEPSFLRAEIANYILKLIDVVGELPAEKPLPQCKDFDLPEDPVAARIARQAEEAKSAQPKPANYGAMNINYFRNRIVTDIESARAEFEVAKTNAACRLSAAQKYEIAFMLESFSYSDKDTAALTAKFKSLDHQLKADIPEKARIEAIEWAGAIALKRNMNEYGRAIWSFRESFIQKQQDLSYTVKWSDKPIRNATDWEMAGAKDEPLTRPFGDNDLSFLVTDVSTGNRGDQASGGNKASKEPASFAVVADYWGIHFRFTDMNKEALLVRDRVKSGTSWEAYIAPGFDAPYTCALFFQAPDTPCEFWNTAYSAAGIRRIPKTMLPETFRYAKTYSEFYDDRICSYIDLSWENYANAIPGKDSIWPFEPARWRDGNPTWNGLKGIHCRSSWGKLTFDIPERGRIAIQKRLLLLCKQAFRGAAAIGHWSDYALGDLVFNETCIKPLQEKYKPVLDAIKPDMTDKEVAEIADEHLAELWDIKYTVQRMRERFLAGRYEKRYPPKDIPVYDATVLTNNHNVVSLGNEDGTPAGHYGVSATISGNGNEIKCVWSNGKGGNCGPYATSKDKGKTWTREDANLPQSYSNYFFNCPVIKQVWPNNVAPRLFIFASYDSKKAADREAPFNRGLTASGAAPLGIIYSDNHGKTWTEAPPADLPADITPTGITRLQNGNLALFGQEALPNGDSVIWMSLSSDGGLTWGKHKVIAKKEGCAFGEPGVIRSRNDKGIGLIFAENKGKKSSFFSYTDNDGATWTEPKELSPELAGIGHKGARLADRLYFIAFRDRKEDSPTRGQLVGWVGTWEDIVNGHRGTYRIHIEESIPAETEDEEFSNAAFGFGAPYNKYITTVSNAKKAGDAKEPRIMMQMLNMEETHNKIRPRLLPGSHMWR